MTDQTSFPTPEPISGNWGVGQTVERPNRPKDPNSSGKRLSRTEAKSNLMTALAMGERVNQSELCKRWGWPETSKSSVSELVTELEGQQLCERRPVGRCKVIVAVQRQNA